MVLKYIQLNDKQIEGLAQILRWEDKKGKVEGEYLMKSTEALKDQFKEIKRNLINKYSPNDIKSQ